MYFEDRAQAGDRLAKRIVRDYRYENCAVVALSGGAVLVGEKIAAELHCILTMLLMEDIQVPGESVSFGGVTQSGSFTYNGTFSDGEINEYTSEFHGYLEEQKRLAFQKINRLLGDGGVIDHDMLRDHVIILVSDGIDDGATLDAAIDFLKPVRIKKLVIAAPTASVSAVDKLHIMADELHILDVKPNFMGIDHYYEKNELPSHEETIAKINEIVLSWR